jgi:hypothetical protein
LKPLLIRLKLALKFSAAETLLRLGHVLYRLAEQCSSMVKQLYAAVDEGNAEIPDQNIYLLLKQSDGQYVFHGVVAKDKEGARNQAWKIPGSLMVLDSLPEFRMKLLSENNRRQEYERSMRSG